MNHKWKDNVCDRCGLNRIKRSWKLLMAISDHPPYNHYQYGTGWYYGYQHSPGNKTLIRSVGFERPDCKDLRETNI